MSLFVGNVSKHVSHRQLENLFKKYGKCRIDLRDRFAFVQFDDSNHAEAAKKQLQHETFHGLELNLEWSKNSGRFGENNKRKDGAVQRKRSRSRQNRENRWRRQDRWGRRSPSNERSSPSYSGNKDIETFVPVCPRDEIIIKKLTAAKAKEQESKSRQSHRRDAQATRNHNLPQPLTTQNGNEQTPREQKTIVEENGNNQTEAARHIEEEEGIVQQDGEIPASTR